MRVLQLTLGFYPARGWGGPVKVVYQNGRELIRRGHTVAVYCTNLLDKRTKIQPGTFERDVDGMHVTYFDAVNIKQWPGTLGPVWLPDLPARVNREIGAFDVVHINGYRNPMLLPVVRAARRAGIPIVTQPHGTMPIVMNSFLAKRAYDFLWGTAELSGISFLIALQESERQQAISRGVPPERVVIIPNGIEVNRDRSLPPRGGFRQRLGLDPRKPMILFLARINRKKGADMLLEAFASLSNRDAQLVIAGPDDGQLAEVQGLIKRYELSGRVWLPGLLSGPDVLSAFQDADLFVLPCRTDTFPMTILESCLAGTPMVVTDRCEIAGILEDSVATIVPFDSGQFSVAMDDLLVDRAKYARYKKKCSIMIAEMFSIQAAVDKLESVYQRAIGEKRSTP